MKEKHKKTKARKQRKKRTKRKKRKPKYLPNCQKSTKLAPKKLTCVHMCAPKGAHAGPKKSSEQNMSEKWAQHGTQVEPRAPLWRPQSSNMPQKQPQRSSKIDQKVVKKSIKKWNKIWSHFYTILVHFWCRKRTKIVFQKHLKKVWFKEIEFPKNMKKRQKNHRFFDICNVIFEEHIWKQYEQK